MVKFTNSFLCTDGSGYWSDRQAVVKVLGMDVTYINDEQDFGELRVYFDTRTWNVNTDGLIYTDRNFLSSLRQLLNDLGYAGQDVEYSEQGMQGDDFVSLDIGQEFLQSWLAQTVDL